MESESEIVHFCGVCGLSAKSICGGCRTVYYCSQIHQKEHWKVHKEVCTPYKTTIDLQSQCGKEHLIASRDLKAGIIVLEETAAFYFPTWFFYLVGQSKRELNFDNQIDQLCITCGKLVTSQPVHCGSRQNLGDGNCFPCSRCGWPVCSKECEKNKIHVENECAFFTEHQLLYPLSESPKIDIKFDSSQIASAYRVKYTYLIGMIRGLGLKQRKPQLFAKLQSISEENEKQNFVLNNELQTFLVDSLIQLKVWQFHSSHPEATVEQLMEMPLENEQDFVSMFRVIQSQQFIISKIDHMWGDPQPKSTSYIYPNKTSLISHSCVPNCCWTIGPPPEYKIRIRTSVPIKKGERFTISRSVIPRVHYEATYYRLLALQNRGILCNCERCTDPTELGLYSSALACPQCLANKKVSVANNMGYLLPENPLLADKTSWKCNNISNDCNYKIEASEHQEIINGLIDKIQAMTVQLDREESEKKENAEYNHIYRDEMGNRAVKFSETWGLHPNHNLIHYLIKTSVMIPFNIKQVPFTSPEIIRRRKERLLYCLEFEDKISPGLSVERARVLATILKLFYSVLSSPDWTKHMTSEEIYGGYRLFQKACLEAARFYKNEFHRPDEKMNVEADMIPKVVQLVEAMNLPWLQFSSV